MQRLAKQTLPGTITTSFQGTAQIFQSSLQNLTLLLLVAVMVIYLVLGILYESFIHPLTILSGLPSAGLGALLTLLLFGRELDVYAFVGLIMLIGIVEKNAIMMIDFALTAQREEGKEAEEAIFEACPDQIPADHDDDHGGVDGYVADRAWLGCRRRVAPRIGSGGCRRARSIAGADAVSDAGCLYLLRAVACVVYETTKGA